MKWRTKRGKNTFSITKKSEPVKNDDGVIKLSAASAASVASRSLVASKPKCGWTIRAISPRRTEVKLPLLSVFGTPLVESGHSSPTFFQSAATNWLPKNVHSILFSSPCPLCSRSLVTPASQICDSLAMLSLFAHNCPMTNRDSSPTIGRSFHGPPSWVTPV